MTQFLLLARPRQTPAAIDLDLKVEPARTPCLIGAAGKLFASETAFTLESTDGQDFGAWFDGHPAHREKIGALIDACASGFGAIAFFYGDTNDLDKAASLEELKRVVSEQALSRPPELYAFWIDELPSA